jgi:hypothetical protein
MRGNLRALLRKYGSLIFFLLFLFAAGFLITQEGGEDDDSPGPAEQEFALDEFAGEDLTGQFGEEALPEWTAPGPPRWFRSNAGGMALEEIPSRLAALRNEYVLVIDYINPNELPVFLTPFYQDSFTVEIRILYIKREESRRQWLFRDNAGTTRLAAVFFDSLDAAAAEQAEAEGETPEAEGPAEGEDTPPGSPLFAEAAEDPDAAAPPDDAADDEKPAARRVIDGFIEVYNDMQQITAEYRFFDDGEETLTDYFYNRNTLVKAEGRRRTAGEGKAYQAIYTDNYRYNRSFSLRSVERIYHEQAEAEPVRLVFPARVLDAALEESFLSEKVTPVLEFFGDTYAQAGYRMDFVADERGRILTQTLLDTEDQEVWVIKNTWSGDRIVATLKITGEEEMLVEYEYDGEGNRIVERNVRNGVLERLVRSDGQKETEELYMNDVVILRAIWENGRKISEERVRSR